MAPPRKQRGGKRGRPTKDTTAAVEEESTTGTEAAATDEQTASTTSNDPTTTIATAPNDTTTQAYSITTVIEESPEPAAKIARVESKEQEEEKKEEPPAAAATTIITSTTATPMTGDTIPITTSTTQTINKEQPDALTTSGSYACEQAGGASIESIHPLITPNMTAHATVPTIPTAATAVQTGQASLVQSSGLEAAMTDATTPDSVGVTSGSIAALTTTSAGTITTDTDVVMESTSATESKMKESTSVGVNEEKKEGGETAKTSSFLAGIKGKKSQQPPVVISRPGNISSGASGESVVPPPSQLVQRVGQQVRPSATGQTTATGDARSKPAVTSRPPQPGRKAPTPAATRTPAVPTKSSRERGQRQVVRPPVAPMTMMQPPQQLPAPFLPPMTEAPMFPPFMDELVQEYGARGLLNDRTLQIFQEFDPNVTYFSFGFEPTPASVNDAQRVQAAMMAEIESAMGDLQRLTQDESQERVNAILGGASNGLGLYQQRLQARTEDYLAMESELTNQENSFIEAEQSMAQFQQFIAENSMAQQGGMATNMNLNMNMNMGPMGGIGPAMGGRPQ